MSVPLLLVSTALCDHRSSAPGIHPVLHPSSCNMVAVRIVTNLQASLRLPRALPYGAHHGADGHSNAPRI
jgi:hypothetical protein